MIVFLKNRLVERVPCDVCGVLSIDIEERINVYILERVIKRDLLRENKINFKIKGSLQNI